MIGVGYRLPREGSGGVGWLGEQPREARGERVHRAAERVRYAKLKVNGDPSINRFFQDTR